jgi:hypothetical protein
MATEVKRRRGTTAQHVGFIGAEAEITVDIEKYTLLVHDDSGLAPTGHELLRADFSNIPTSVTADVTIVGEVDATKFSGDLTGAIHVQGKNATSGTLTKGTPVYISGSQGQQFTIGVADADDSAKMPCIGILAADVNASAEGDIVTHGKLIGIDTSSFTVGDELYISDSGTLTATPPTGESDLLQKIAKVIRVHASSGQIYIMGAGRTNAVPNLDQNKIFLGDSNNQAVATALSSIGLTSFNDDSTFLKDADFGSNGLMKRTSDGVYATITDSSSNWDAAYTYSQVGHLPLTGGTISHNLIISGNLTVSGTTTTVNTETINLADNIITLNSNFTGNNPTENAGIEVERGDLTNKSFFWDEANDRWNADSSLVASSFIKQSNSGGFLKADGTEDTSTYLTTVTEAAVLAHADNYDHWTVTVGLTSQDISSGDALTLEAGDNVTLEIDGANVTINSSLPAGAIDTISTSNTSGLSSSESGGDVTLNLALQNLTLATSADASADSVAILDGLNNTKKILLSNLPLISDDDFSSNGLMKRTGAGTYDIVTDNSSNWDTAYGWGDHSTEGYLTAHPTIGGNATNQTNSGTTVIQSLTFDSNGHVLTVGSTTLNQVTDTNDYIASVSFDTSAFTFSADYNTGSSIPNITSVSWSHNHDGRYYTETEVGNFFSGTTSISGYNKSNWDTAYGWGNHANAGYLTAVPSEFLTQTEGDARYLELSGGTLTGSLTVQSVTAISTSAPKFQLKESDTTDENKEILLSGGDFFIRNLNDDGTVPSGENILKISHEGVVTLLAQGTTTAENLNALFQNSDGVLKRRTLGSNAFNSTAFLTSFDITTQTDPKYLRSNASDTTTGNITISKDNPTLTLVETNTATGSYPRINFDTGNNQGVSLYHNEFDSELSANGYGLVLDASPSNTQFPSTGTLSFSVLGEIYAGGTTLSSLNKVFHDGYHPNADTLTTAREITLGGDLTGSAFFDGSADITISAQVTNNSHTHDDRYLQLSGGTLTGDLTVGNNSTDRSVRVYHSDNAYTEMRGYGIQFNRASSYIRPTGDNNKNMYFGTDGKTWANISFDATAVQFSKNDVDYLTISSGGDVDISNDLNIDGSFTNTGGNASWRSSGSSYTATWIDDKTVKFVKSASAYAAVTPYGEHQNFIATFSFKTSNSTHLGLVYHGQNSPSEDGYNVIIRSTNTVRVQKRQTNVSQSYLIGGVGGTAISGVDIDDGNWHRVTVQVIGQKIRVDIDGNQIINDTINDTTFTEGGVGYIVYDGTVEFNNLEVQEIPSTTFVDTLNLDGISEGATNTVALMWDQGRNVTYRTLGSNAFNSDTIPTASDFLPITGGTLTGQLTSADIIPNADDTEFLGGTANRWRTLYATRIRTDILREADGTNVLGMTSTTRDLYGLDGNVRISFEDDIAITNSNVLIGTTTAQNGTKLQVAGVLDVWSSTNTLLRFNHDGTRGIIETFTGGSYSNTAINPNGGKVGIGTTTPNSLLHVDGDMSIQGAWFWYSQYESTSGAGVSNGITVEWRDNNTAISSAYMYKVRLTTSGTGTNSGATYIVNYNPDTTSWEVRAVNISGNTSNHPLLAESSGTLVAYTNHSTSYPIRILTESYLCSDNDGTFHNMGADFHWQRSVNNLFYNDGNVGIGTNSPDYKLDVAGDIGVDEYIYHNGDTNTFIRLRNDDVRIDAGGRRVIQMSEGTDPDKIVLGDSTTTTYTDGNVGIGATSPSAKLHVEDSSAGAGVVLKVKNTGANGAAQLDLVNDAQSWFVNTRTDDKFSIYNNTASTTALTIDTNDNVGIGTTSPATELDVEGTITANNLTLNNLVSNTSDTTVLTFDQAQSVRVRTLGSNAFNSTSYLPLAGGTLTGNLTVPNQIIHSGDTNCYMQFHSSDQWRVVTGGAERIEVSNVGIIINDGSNDYDFRVESNGNANMIKVNGGNDAVGIGIDPSSGISLHVYHPTADAPMKVQSGDSFTGITFQDTSSTNHLFYRGSQNHFYFNGSGVTLGVGVNSITTTNLSLDVENKVRASGIMFGSDTTDANTLDDYEEGSWTPVYASSSATVTSSSYDPVTFGRYIKVGNVVHLWARMRTDTLVWSSSSGSVYISGVPFTVTDVLSGPIQYAGSIGYANAWGGEEPQKMSLNGSELIFLYYNSTTTSNSSNIQPSDTGSGANSNDIVFQLTYRTD